MISAAPSSRSPTTSSKKARWSGWTSRPFPWIPSKCSPPTPRPRATKLSKAPACPLCSFEHPEYVFLSQEQPVFQCPGCGLLFLLPKTSSPKEPQGSQPSQSGAAAKARLRAFLDYHQGAPGKLLLL